MALWGTCGGWKGRDVARNWKVVDIDRSKRRGHEDERRMNSLVAMEECCAFVSLRLFVLVSLVSRHCLRCPFDINAALLVANCGLASLHAVLSDTIYKLQRA